MQRPGALAVVVHPEARRVGHQEVHQAAAAVALLAAREAAHPGAQGLAGKALRVDPPAVDEVARAVGAQAVRRAEVVVVLAVR